MQIYNEIEGNLITLAKEGSFDIIAHGCNCFCAMKRGIAPQMAEAFGCDEYSLEQVRYKGDINKLGQIDYQTVMLSEISSPNKAMLNVVNCYTQYHWSSPEHPKPFDYQAFKLCMRKINHLWKNQHIGLPMIGSHLAGGNWDIIREIIVDELKDMRVTIVKYKP
jgi:O-acetyl-ADP-ribose deacetylase (regulator of RNase III)